MGNILYVCPTFIYEIFLVTMRLGGSFDIFLAKSYCNGISYSKKSKWTPSLMGFLKENIMYEPDFG